MTTRSEYTAATEAAKSGRSVRWGPHALRCSWAVERLPEDLAKERRRRGLNTGRVAEETGISPVRLVGIEMGWEEATRPEIVSLLRWMAGFSVNEDPTE